MPKFQNVSPLGDLFTPLTGEVKAGEIIEVSADVAVKLSTQPGNWEPIVKKGVGE